MIAVRQASPEAEKMLDHASECLGCGRTLVEALREIKSHMATKKEGV